MNCFEACLTAGSLADLVIIANAGGLAHPADALLGRSALGTVPPLFLDGVLWHYCQLLSGIHDRV